MTTWPLQSQCDDFYGNPRGANAHANPAWEAQYLTTVPVPFHMYYAGANPVTHIRINKNCAASLSRVLDRLWNAAGKSQAKIDSWGVSVFGGSYNYRLMRGSNRLSMHSYGCAIDLDPANHPMVHGSKPFAQEVIDAFAAEGWVNLPNDKMHFQAARVN